MQKLGIDDLGGAKVDATAKHDPDTQVDASEWNTTVETVAQGSYTSPGTVGTFVTTGTAAPTTVSAANVAHSSHYGNADGTKPTVSKTATGRYTLTFPASWTNGLDTLESVSFFEGEAIARSSDATDNVYAEVLTIATNVVTVKTESPKGTLADVGNNSAAAFTVGWRMYR